MLPASLSAVVVTCAVLLSTGATAQEPAPGDAPSATRVELEALKRAVEAQRAETESLRRLMMSSLDSVEASHEAPVRLYGFLDTGLQKFWANPSGHLTSFLPSNASTFVLGNLNLYVDAQPTEHWSALIEVRLTTLPNGEDQVGTPGSPYQRTSTIAYDLTSTSGGWSEITLGSIVLNRAYIQWRHSDQLMVRAGLFLTPLGIWNEDHGTPTLISLKLPGSQTGNTFPTSQVGVEALGSYALGTTQLGYAAYVSNGRTPGQFDLTDDKMFGGRVTARPAGSSRMTFGLSGLEGRFSDQTRTITQFTPLAVQKTEVVGYQEQVFGADYALDVGALRLRSELLFRRIQYVPGERASYWVPGLYDSNHNEWDLWVLAAYQLPWFGLEPYVYLEAYRVPLPLGDGVMTPSVGLNVHFNAWAQLKLQYSRDFWFEDLFHGRRGVSTVEDASYFYSRLVFAF